MIQISVVRNLPTVECTYLYDPGGSANNLTVDGTDMPSSGNVTRDQRYGDCRAFLPMENATFLTSRSRPPLDIILPTQSACRATASRAK